MKKVTKNSNNKDTLFVFTESVRISEKSKKILIDKVKEARFRVSVLFIATLFLLYFSKNGGSFLSYYAYIVPFTLSLFTSFVTKGTNAGVKVKENFKYDWSGEGIRFLSNYNEVLEENKNDLKHLLHKLCLLNNISVFMVAFILIMEAVMNAII